MTLRVHFGGFESCAVKTDEKFSSNVQSYKYGKVYPLPLNLHWKNTFSILTPDEKLT